MSDKKPKKEKKAKPDKNAPAVEPVLDEDGNPVPPAEGETAELDLDGKKKSKKTLFIIIGAVVLLIGAGAGVYFSGLLDPILGKTADTTEDGAAADATGDKAATGDKKPEKKKEAKKDDKKKGEKGKEGESGVSDNFMELPDLIVNLSSNQGPQRYLKLKVQLELEDATDKAAVEAIAPRVIDHFQTYLRELRVSDLRGSAGIYRLRQELLARVNAAAAPVEVKDVLFQEILIQ